MGCLTGIFGSILPRFALLVGWFNDQAAWEALLGSNLMFWAGFILLPWTTLIYGFVAPNGMTTLNWIFLAMAVLIDIGSWGIGLFAGRKEYSNYRGS